MPHGKNELRAWGLKIPTGIHIPTMFILYSLQCYSHIKHYVAHPIRTLVHIHRIHMCGIMLFSNQFQ